MQNAVEKLSAWKTSALTAVQEWMVNDMGQALEMCVNCETKRSCDTCTDLHNWIMEHLEPKQEWISVKDRLPEDDLPKDSEKKQIDVLVAIQREDDYGWLVRSQTRVKDKFWTDPEPEWNWGTHPRGEVTHWRPLPEPPKEGE